MQQGESNEGAASLSQLRTPRRRLRIGRLALAALPVAGAAWLAWAIFHGWTSARLERLIAAEVAPGCGRADVEAFLDRHNIWHAYVGGMGPETSNARLARQAGLDERGLSGRVQGEIGMDEANEHWLLPSEIVVDFFFDHQGRLVRHRVEAAIYGP